ncbi:MAG: RNA methyltransferase [Alphaproteobacteria bacterium]
MAGTDSTQAPKLGGPAVILIEPQLGENIGAAARAMLNCGLTDLRLVNPRDGWPNPKAQAMASGALDGHVDATIHDSTAAAIADLNYVLATTARHRFMSKPIYTARQGALELRCRFGAGQRTGLLFGAERSGMTNDDVALADAILTVPLNPAFSSLNLGQSVLLVGYEWYLTDDATPSLAFEDKGSPPASKADLVNFFERLEAALDSTGFLRLADKRPTMVRNLRNLFQRAELTEQELKTLHGVIVSLMRGPAADG